MQKQYEYNQYYCHRLHRMVHERRLLTQRIFFKFRLRPKGGLLQNEPLFCSFAGKLN